MGMIGISNFVFSLSPFLFLFLLLYHNLDLEALSRACWRFLKRNVLSNGQLIHEVDASLVHCGAPRISIC